VKGTRLWQAPGSPIIQGRSRTERPFWERWLAGAISAEAIVLLVAVVWAFREPGAAFGAVVGSVLLTFLLPAMPGCAAGAALGVWISRSMGWRRDWVAGAVLGAILATATVAVL